MKRKQEFVIEKVPAMTLRPSDMLAEEPLDRRRWRCESLDWGPEDQTPLKMRLFLNSLAQCPNVTKAAKDGGTWRRSVYKWRDTIPEFAADWDDAIEEGCDHLEEVAYKRAEEGLSEKLLIFLLKAYRGWRFNEVRVVEADLTVRAVREMTDDELANIAARSGGRAALPPPGPG